MLFMTRFHMRKVDGGLCEETCTALVNGAIGDGYQECGKCLCNAENAVGVAESATVCGEHMENDCMCTQDTEGNSFCATFDENNCNDSCKSSNDCTRNGHRCVTGLADECGGEGSFCRPACPGVDHDRGQY